MFDSVNTVAKNVGDLSTGVTDVALNALGLVDDSITLGRSTISIAQGAINTLKLEQELEQLKLQQEIDGISKPEETKETNQFEVTNSAG